MKPDWEDAPEWAKWLAMDSSGDWYWFEDKPATYHVSWVATKGRCRFACNVQEVPWHETSEARP